MAAPGVLVAAAAALVAAAMFVQALSGHAGPDPAKWLLHRSGVLALALLLATLSVSTLRRWRQDAALLRWRRPLGLAAFAFVTLHLFVYAVLYESLSWPAISEDLSRRPYILVGAACFLLLLPMALTSTRAMLRRLGAVRWQRLHRAIYVAVPLAIVHQGMAQKADLGQTLLFSAIAGCFLIERMVAASRQAGAVKKRGEKAAKGR